MSVTTDELRRELALAMGWREVSDAMTLYGTSPVFLNPFGFPAHWLPELTLDWVAECRKTLDPHLRNDYISELWTICGNEAQSANSWTEYNFRAFWSCIDATAEQQAQALLAVLKQRQSLPERLEGEK